MNIKQLLLTLACVTCVSHQGFGMPSTEDDDVYEMQEKLDLGIDEHHTPAGTPTVPNKESESVIEDVEEKARKAKDYLVEETEKAKDYVEEKAKDAEEYIGEKAHEAKDYVEGDSDKEEGK